MNQELTPTPNPKTLTLIYKFYQTMENLNVENQEMQTPPSNHLAMAIISTILCCNPLGIVSIVYASQVNSKFQAGDYAGAQKASKNAKTWWIVAIVLSFIAVIGYAVFFFAFAGDAFMEEFQREMERQQSLQ